MTQEFRTHQEIDNHYRAQGVDVDRLNREFNDLKNAHKQFENSARVYFNRNAHLLQRFNEWFLCKFWIDTNMFDLTSKSRIVKKARRLGFKEIDPLD